MCLYPLKAYRFHDFETGESKLSFTPLPSYDEVLSLPCGKCVECLSVYSSEWANRCMLEATLHKQNCVIALTYAKTDGSLHKDDLQKFIKRLRDYVKVPIRYFACGEYGKKGGRPHYHIIVFGWRPSDLERFFVRDGHNVYKSAKVAQIWSSDVVWRDLPRTGGFISVEDLTPLSAKYCAKYLQKLNTVPDGCLKPFTLMSLKPGIGLEAFDVKSFETDSIYLNGRQCSIPRYFRRKYGIDNGYNQRKLRGILKASTLKARRQLAREKFSKIFVN